MIKTGSNQQPRRRLFQFSLASLLAVVAVVGILLGPVVNRVRHQQRVIAQIQALGGKITFAHELLGTDEQPTGPLWLRRWLGEDYFRTVRLIELQGTGADDDLVEQISSLRDVEQLGLTQTDVTDATLRHVASMWKLKALSVSFNPITDNGLNHLAPLDELVFLDLDATKVTDKGLPALKELNRLYHLKLYANPITNAGAATLAELPQLGELDLGNTLITNDGLAPLAKLPNLSRLRLDQMITGEGQELRISDDGLSHLSRMLQLNEVGLVSLAVTNEGLARLQKQRPALTIRR